MLWQIKQWQILLSWTHSSATSSAWRRASTTRSPSGCGRTGGLGAGTFELLRYVRDHPGARVADLAAAFALGVGTTSKIVDRQEKEGWLERRPNPANRRSSLLTLTPAGESHLSRAEPAWQAALQDFLGPALTSGELTVLSRALGALRTDLEQRRLGLPAG